MVLYFNLGLLGLLVYDIIRIISMGLFGFYNLSGSWSWSIYYWSNSGYTSIYLNISNIEKTMVIAFVLLYHCVCFIFKLDHSSPSLCNVAFICSHMTYSFQDIIGVHRNVTLGIDGWLTLQTLNDSL